VIEYDPEWWKKLKKGLSKEGFGNLFTFKIQRTDNLPWLVIGAGTFVLGIIGLYFTMNMIRKG